MTTAYNRFADQSLQRLAAFSDGIFEVAMTLLVPDLGVPARELVTNSGSLGRALLSLAPQLISYMMSFPTLGIFWFGQQTQLNSPARSSRSLSWIPIVFLFAVSLIPFSPRACWRRTSVTERL